MLTVNSFHIEDVKLNLILQMSYMLVQKKEGKSQDEKKICLKNVKLDRLYKIEINRGAAPPLDLHFPDPATPLSAARDQWCSWGSSLRQ